MKELLADIEPPSMAATPEQVIRFRTLEAELRSHFGVEESLYFPSLLAMKSKTNTELVRTARREQKAILENVRAAVASDDAEEEGMQSLVRRIVAYLEFEETRLIPRLKLLPEVTLHEMSLELEELETRQGRLR